MKKFIPVNPLFSVILLFSIAYAQPNQADALLVKGQNAYESNRFSEAATHFQEALRYDRDAPDAFTYLGNIQFILGDYGQSETYFSRALEQALKNFRQSPQGTYKKGTITILDPQPSSVTSTTFAMLYNNRGAANYRLGKLVDAKLDFEEALSFDPNLIEAQQNLNEIALGGNGQVNTRMPSSSTGTRPGYGGRYATQYKRADNRFQRPANALSAVDIRDQRQDAEEVRENRIELYDMQQPGGVSRGPLDFLKAKEFVSRRVPTRGKTYREPEFGSASRNYLTIQEVKILPRETRVTVQVKNPDTRKYQVQLARPNSEQAYYITDRSGSSRRIVRLKAVEGAKTNPDAADLPANGKLVFTLVFNKIPDDMGFINLIEGSTDNASSWNFYGVDLTR